MNIEEMKTLKKLLDKYIEEEKANFEDVKKDIESEYDIDYVSLKNDIERLEQAQIIVDMDTQYRIDSY